MGRFRRSYPFNRIIVRNDKIYASYTFGGMGALFALRPLKKGEILAEYTGKILTKKAADESSSHHLIRAFKQTRAGADTAVDRVIDGRGELAGFANYAPFDIANAFVLDILPTLLKKTVDLPSRTAVVLVAKQDIPKGQEIRFDYDMGGDQQMFRMMRQSGVADEALRSRLFLGTTWIEPPPPPNHSGMVERNFRHDTLAELGLDVDKQLRKVARL